MQLVNANENRILSDFDKEKTIEKLEICFGEILHHMGFNWKIDQQITGTPKRWAKMMVNELCSGCYSEEPNITVFENTKKYDEMVFLGPIQIKSICSHHFVPFMGFCYCAYLPNKKVVGISKLSRIVRWYMRRPQIQEELTKQIADYIQKILKPKGSAVFIEATHLCMIMRGVEEGQNTKMCTSALRGAFLKEESTRQEFFNMLNKK